ncbi:MAG: hypothetical protein CMO44_18485 [Verrucomicrobiales bacterium]|nr:hypothetical protein [Verrucomicrobiales bacterium]
MEAQLNSQKICMSIGMSAILFYNRNRFFYVMENCLSNKSSRDSNTKISKKCCRTYYCNANKCILADPNIDRLTPDSIFRQNYKLWIKGKHLTCDVMKKYIRTKKNDFQPALKKMFEWLLWEIKHYPCTCSKCSELHLFLAQQQEPRKQYRCPNCLCGLNSCKGLAVSCHNEDGSCKGKQFCSFCFRYKPVCSFKKMMDHLKLCQMTKDFDFINHVFCSSSFICNMCFVSNKRLKFVNILDARDTLEKSLSSEDIVLRQKRRRQKVDVLPNDVLLQDLNWHIPRELTFLETKSHMQDVINKNRSDIIALENKKKEVVREFKKKLSNIKNGNYQDITFIEQMVMLVERKKRDKIRIDMEKGTVLILQ